MQKKNRMKHISSMSPAPSIFHPVTNQAEDAYHLTNYFIVASSFILIVVIALLIYISIKYRGKPTDEEPEQIKGNKWVETVMIGIPFLLVGAFFYYTAKAMHSINPSDINRPPDVTITGYQWWWEAQYPGAGTITANEIHLPVGKRILLQLKAADVIHDWWIPEFGQKMDMIPGSPNHLWLTIKQPGVYEGACSEFCGQQHAWMRIKVIAQDSAQYQQWLQSIRQPAIKPADSLAQMGALLFNKESCANCHRIRGTDANGSAGPDLTHFASRQEFLAGLMKNNRSNLYQWLSDPQKVKPGAHMPRFIFQKDSINALVQYISSLK